MTHKIKHKGFGFTSHIATIENFFFPVKGIDIERITIDFVELNVNKSFPTDEYIRLSGILMKKLKSLKENGD